MKKILTRSVRKYLYTVSISAVAALVYFGKIEPEASPIVLGFIVALLNLPPEGNDYGPRDRASVADRLNWTAKVPRHRDEP